jgi:tetratricopeptide (TPR) repeat protein
MLGLVSMRFYTFIINIFIILRVSAVFRAPPKSRTNIDVLPLYKQAQTCIKTGALIEASKLLEKCIELEPRDSHSWLSLARLKSSLGHVDEARLLFEKSLTHCEENVYILHAWGHMEQKQGNCNAAKLLWNRILRVDPLNAYVCHALSQLENKIGNYKQSLLILERVIKSRPTTELYSSLAETYIAINEYDKAKSTLMQALASPKVDRSKILLSLASMEEVVFKNLTSAKELIDEAMSIDDENVNIYISKANIEMKQFDYVAARKTLSHASKIDAVDGKHYMLWSTIELESGNYVLASEILEEGSSKYPSDPFILQRWGIVEAKLGNNKKARQLFAKSAQIRPHAPTFVAWAMLEESEIRRVNLSYLSLWQNVYFTMNILGFDG